MNYGIYLFCPKGLDNEITLFWAGGKDSSTSKDMLLIFLGMLLQMDRALVAKLKKLVFEDNTSLSCTWAGDALPSPIILSAAEDAWKSLRAEQLAPVNHFFETESKQ